MRLTPRINLTREKVTGLPIKKYLVKLHGDNYGVITSITNEALSVTEHQGNDLQLGNPINFSHYVIKNEMIIDDKESVRFRGDGIPLDLEYIEGFGLLLDRAGHELRAQDRRRRVYGN